MHFAQGFHLRCHHPRAARQTGSPQGHRCHTGQASGDHAAMHIFGQRISAGLPRNPTSRTLTRRLIVMQTLQTTPGMTLGLRTLPCGALGRGGRHLCSHRARQPHPQPPRARLHLAVAPPQLATVVHHRGSSAGRQPRQAPCPAPRPGARRREAVPSLLRAQSAAAPQASSSGAQGRHPTARRRSWRQRGRPRGQRPRSLPRWRRRRPRAPLRCGRRSSSFSCDGTRTSCHRAAAATQPMHRLRLPASSGSFFRSATGLDCEHGARLCPVPAAASMWWLPSMYMELMFARSGQTRGP